MANDAWFETLDTVLRNVKFLTLNQAIRKKVLSKICQNNAS